MIRPTLLIMNEVLIDNFDVPRRRRPELLLSLFEECSAHSLRCVLTTDSYLRKYRPLLVAHHEKCGLFNLGDNDHREQLIAMITKISPWHYSKFCVICGEAGLLEELSDKTEALGLAIPEMEKVIDTKIHGYCFPLDEALEFRGDHIMAEIFSSLAQNFATR